MSPFLMLSSPAELRQTTTFRKKNFCHHPGLPRLTWLCGDVIKRRADFSYRHYGREQVSKLEDLKKQPSPMLLSILDETLRTLCLVAARCRPADALFHFALFERGLSSRCVSLLRSLPCSRSSWPRRRRLPLLPQRSLRPEVSDKKSAGGALAMRVLVDVMPVCANGMLCVVSRRVAWVKVNKKKKC